MNSAFRNISRVSTLSGGTRWYLSEDCLLAAKRIMYAVEYRRFYLRDLDSVVVWPSPRWRLRLIPGILVAFLGAYLWEFVNSTAGAIFVSIALAWVALELALGPTARSRIRTTGATVELPLVKRTRRAPEVLAKIDVAVRATRGPVERPSAPAPITSVAEAHPEERSEASATTSVPAATQTNGS